MCLCSDSFSFSLSGNNGSGSRLRKIAKRFRFNSKVVASMGRGFSTNVILIVSAEVSVVSVSVEDAIVILSCLVKKVKEMAWVAFVEISSEEIIRFILLGSIVFSDSVEVIVSVLIIGLFEKTVITYVLRCIKSVILTDSLELEMTAVVDAEVKMVEAS